MASVMEKDTYTYTAQGMAQPTVYSDTIPATTTYTNPYASNQCITPTPGSFDNTNTPVYDNSATGKAKRFYSKIENSLRKKFDSTSGPNYRSDPLGGYTLKGPGYYEKKHKFTRRVTRRGNPPPMGATTTATAPALSSTTY